MTNKNQNEKLKECRKCLSTDVYLSPLSQMAGHSDYMVECRACNYHHIASTETLVIQSWNTRPEPDGGKAKKRKFGEVYIAPPLDLSGREYVILGKQYAKAQKRIRELEADKVEVVESNADYIQKAGALKKELAELKANGRKDK